VGDEASPPLIEARDLSAWYGRVNALKPTNLSVGEGELVEHERVGRWEAPTLHVGCEAAPAGGKAATKGASKTATKTATKTAAKTATKTAGKK